MTAFGASFLTRTVLSSASAHTPVSTALVYNGVDMALCGFMYNYFQSRATTTRDKENAELSSIFYSRCIGCISGIIATRLFCERPIHPLFAVGINVAALVACFADTVMFDTKNNLWV